MIAQPSRTHPYYFMLRFLYLEIINLLPTIDSRATKFICGAQQLSTSSHSTNELSEIKENPSGGGQVKRVQWADIAQIKIVERYINAKDGPDEDEEDLYKGSHCTGSKLSESHDQTTLPYTPPSPLPTVPEEAAAEFSPPFPSRITAEIAPGNEQTTYLAQIQALHETLDQLQSLREYGSYQGVVNAGLTASGDRRARGLSRNAGLQEGSSTGPRVNRFRRE
jgi:hypothetical protein